MAGEKICVIGCGPSGLSFLHQFSKLAPERKSTLPDVTCFEKQSNWGGLWNFSWRTGLDEHGEPEHCGMYRDLWTNAPKEANLEYPDYTYEKHFGKLIPSYPPREVLFDYLQGRFSQFDLKKFIKFNHVVRNISYDELTKKFTVSVKDLKNDKLLNAEEFDYVVNCNGHFSVPNVPYIPGLEGFPGRVMHSHDFRNAREFSGKKLLLVGSSYSAEDLALQCIKYGAKSAICAFRTKPMGFKWPKEITERPMVIKLEGNMAHFKDGSTAEVDVIMLCTGYLHHYPYFEEQLRLRGPNLMYLEELYKGTVWMNAGDNKLIYIGAQDQHYSFTMFDAQARWAVKYILGDIKLPPRSNMIQDIQSWKTKESKFKNVHDKIDFQRDYVIDLTEESEYGSDLDGAPLLHDWIHHRNENILTYRDKTAKSIFTGKETPVPQTPWFLAKNDSMECFLNNIK